MLGLCHVYQPCKSVVAINQQTSLGISCCYPSAVGSRLAWWFGARTSGATLAHAAATSVPVGRRINLWGGPNPDVDTWKTLILDEPRCVALDIVHSVVICQWIGTILFYILVASLDELYESWSSPSPALIETGNLPRQDAPTSPTLQAHDWNAHFRCWLAQEKIMKTCWSRNDDTWIYLDCRRIEVTMWGFP